MEYKTVPLFGGALECSVPRDFADVSEIRQVPDNQEVYLSMSGFTSLSIDLCERVTEVVADRAALLYHIDDMIDAGDQYDIHFEDDRVSLPRYAEVPVLIAILRVVPKPRAGNAPSRPNDPNFLWIAVGLIRLSLQLTDIVITLNMPNIPGNQQLTEEGEQIDHEKGQHGKAFDEAKRTLNDALRSLNIKDWGLFGPGG